MINAVRGLALALVVASGGAAHMAMSAGIALESYVPTQIATLNRQMPHDPMMLVSIDTATPRFRVLVTYTKNTRPLTEGSALMLDSWAKALRISPQVRGLFVSEVQVTEGDASYWLPIQEPVLKYLREEPREGGAADFYIARVGSVRSGPIYVVNEYQLR